MLSRERNAIAERLARVCKDLPADEFEALVSRIAEIEVKYRMRRVADHGHR